MKKFGAFLFVSTLLLTGCGQKKVTCSATMEEGGKKVTTEVNANLKNDKVDSVSAKMTFDDESTAQETCGLLKLASSMSSDDSKKIDYKCDGKTITINNYNLLSEDDNKMVGLTKEEFIDQMKKSAEEEGIEFKCN